MRLFGYARVSPSRQALALQVRMLREEGVEPHRIFTDQISGRSLKCLGLHTLQLKVEKGDVILITNLDRLGRDTADMIQLINEFDPKRRGRQLPGRRHHHRGHDGWDGDTILSAVAQTECERILERTNERRLEAKANGVRVGRKSPALTANVFSNCIERVWEPRKFNDNYKSHDPPSISSLTRKQN